MGTLHFRRVERRRTARVALCVDLIVQGRTHDDAAFRAEARTLSVSRHGGMLAMDPEVAMGQKLTLINLNSGEKAECKVVGTKTERGGKRHIAFEFTTIGLNFWKMYFPAAGSKPLRRAAQAHFERVLASSVSRED